MPSGAMSGLPRTAPRAPRPGPPRRTPGQTQRHESPAWMHDAGRGGAARRAPLLKRAWKRTSAPGWAVRRCEASAFMAVSMQPPAISTRTRATTKAHRCWVRLMTTSSPAQANSAIQSRRRAPTRSARCPMTALERAGQGHGQGQQDAELGVGEVEGALDVEDHDGPAAPEQAEGDEGGDRPGPTRRGRLRRPAGAGLLIRARRLAPALARNVASSTSTRVTRPAPTSPPPSRSRRAAETVKMRRRPSTLTRVASARTTLPTATGARWSNCTRVATLDCAAVRCPSVARQRRLFAQGDEPGRGQHRDIARAEELRRVLLAHRQLDLRREARVRRMPRGRGAAAGGGIGHDDYDTARDRHLLDRA